MKCVLTSVVFPRLARHRVLLTVETDRVRPDAAGLSHRFVMLNNGSVNIRSGLKQQRVIKD